MTTMFYKSQSAYKESEKLIPGGVNSPVRAFRSVESTPVFFKSGNGSKMTDIMITYTLIALVLGDH